MAIVSTGLIDQVRLDRQVKKAVGKLPKQDVVRVNHSLGSDATGEPSLFFRVVLTDQASREANLADVASRIISTIVDDLRPYENWGLNPYFSFRSKTEQNSRNDHEWA